MRFIRLIIMTALAFWVAAGDPVRAQDDYAAQKVIYHINLAGGDDGSAYKGALNNMRKHLEAVGKANIDHRVVMQGGGVGLLQAAKDNQQLQGLILSLKNDGVRFSVCNDTLVGRDIDPEQDFFDVWPEDIVPSGVAEIAKLPLEGLSISSHRSVIQSEVKGPALTCCQILNLRQPIS